MALVTSPQGQAMNVPDEVADDYIAQGWQSGVPASVVQEWPEGDPSTAWKIPELQAYAAARSIDLGDGKPKKADMLTAIAKAAAEAATPDPDAAPAVSPQEQPQGD